MISTIISLLAGVLAASSAIIAKKPNAKDLIDKLVPYQGWIGVVLLIWSVKSVLLLLKNFNLTLLFMAILQFVVGFLLAYGLISKYLLENNDEAKEKGQALRAKLIQYQVPAGIVLIVITVLRLF